MSKASKGKVVQAGVKEKIRRARLSELSSGNDGVAFWTVKLPNPLYDDACLLSDGAVPEEQLSLIEESIRMMASPMFERLYLRFFSAAGEFDFERFLAQEAPLLCKRTRTRFFKVTELDNPGQPLTTDDLILHDALDAYQHVEQCLTLIDKAREDARSGIGLHWHFLQIGIALQKVISALHTPPLQARFEADVQTSAERSSDGRRGVRRRTLKAPAVEVRLAAHRFRTQGIPERYIVARLAEQFGVSQPTIRSRLKAN